MEKMSSEVQQVPENSNNKISDLPHKVFVYGTLKSGEPNHHVLTDADTGAYSLLHCKATTAKQYPLVVASRYNIPFLLDKAGTGQYFPRITHATSDLTSQHVEGEIYAVDDEKLSALDLLESHPTYYCRRVVQFYLHDGAITEAWAYFLPKFRNELLTLPMIANYSSENSDRPYVDSDDIDTAEDLSDALDEEFAV